MRNHIFEDLRSQGLLNDDSYERLRLHQKNPLFSVHWEIQTAMYLGVLCLSTGLGILVYENIDTIGHQAVLAFIALISSSCFYWCSKKNPPFSIEKVDQGNNLFDYVLLLGTLSFLSFLGYLQYQYSVFGNRYGLASFITMICLFFIAYFYDNRGILSLAIINLAIWMGITVVPRELLEKMDFGTERVIYAYSILGAILLAAAKISTRSNIKKHFAYSYYNYGIHVAYIALLSGYFFYSFSVSFFWLVLLLVLSKYTISNALKDKSFYFLLVAVFYSYIAVSGLIVRSISSFDNDGIFGLYYLYFMSSGIGMTFLLIEMNKKIHSK